MTQPVCEVDNVSIVLVGNFNPRIFQPTWFELHELLPASEVAAAELHLVSPDLTAFKAGDWLTFEATSERFQIIAPSSRASSLRDLASSIFTLLEHTPVSVLGFNRIMHYRLASKDVRSALGRKLAPPDMWPDLLEAPVLRVLRMQGRRPGSGALCSMVIEPSAVFTEEGVFLASNEEHRFAGEGATLARVKIENDFDAAVKFGRDLADALLKDAK